MTEPRNCKFCGNGSRGNRRVRVMKFGKSAYRVVCGECGASGTPVMIKVWHDNKFIAQEQAIRAWNTSQPIEQILRDLQKEAEMWIDVYNESVIDGDPDNYADGRIEALEYAIGLIKGELGIDSDDYLVER